jgi:hypothetical protein
MAIQRIFKINVLQIKIKLLFIFLVNEFKKMYYFMKMGSHNIKSIVKINKVK